MEVLVHVILVWMVVNFVVLAIILEKDYRRIHRRTDGHEAETPVVERKKGMSSQVDATGARNE